jgi:hypothetical protein
MKPMEVKIQITLKIFSITLFSFFLDASLHTIAKQQAKGHQIMAAAKKGTNIQPQAKVSTVNIILSLF